VRSRATAPQASLAWRERARNVRGAFAATRPFAGARVALVDDVMTSGATAAAASAALRRGGAARIEVWVVARTPGAR
jgi:predicted amidophosphoribosyltransferase